MKMRTRLLAIILLFIAAIITAYHEATRGFSYLESAAVVLMLVVIFILAFQKRE